MNISTKQFFVLMALSGIMYTATTLPGKIDPATKKCHTYNKNILKNVAKSTGIAG